MTDRDFNRNFLISLGVHVWLVVMAWLAADVFKNVFQDKNIEIIRSSIRVDVVGMPKLTVQELKAMQRDTVDPEPIEVKGAKVETKVETEDVIKKDDLVIQEESKKKKTSFLNMISDYSNKKIAPKVAKKGANTGVKTNKNLDSLILEGNRLSKGTSLTGDFSDQENSEFSSYVQTIPEQVRKFWKLPSYLKDKDLKCRVKVYLAVTGAILKMELVESSGLPEFDARAQSALREASPFAKPSEQVAQRLANYGIILGFPL